MIINEEKTFVAFLKKKLFEIKIFIFLVSFRVILEFFHSNLTESKYAGFHEKIYRNLNFANFFFITKAKNQARYILKCTCPGLQNLG